ncbi:Nvj3p NDAI_0A01130 [Naumovozyma dairenensis CBS 421]|uniref:PXA domain-containing protein n=1 Tax=Naumovozyma dairenensis (strain ATCC 10597 / BCRC 20456 / CBS 421 / NBRC 0211 / NRRL Y-12639) TaxID=1071378 RepID=G0W383_NAUDC|nr:hypothetical protein NDAI_0A01130 [Naumovozyma dairenensis CBS 421]CCD22271.1 hypothetical protein NDAI_0A01130 [Naumovozyma dairenensis CBS 421]
MPNILYNTNSSLISRFQRNSSTSPVTNSVSLISSSSSSTTSFLSKNNTASLAIGSKFRSKYEKDSEKYLKELCCSIYPKSTHKRINGMKSNFELQINAICALILQNFVLNWYGVKIPTTDETFLIEMFNLIQNLIQYVTRQIRDDSIDFEALLADDIPVILSRHIEAIRKSQLKTTENIDDSSTLYKEYRKIVLSDSDKYPEQITNFIKSLIEGSDSSTLQSSFLDSLFNELLFGRILDSLTEPYYVLNGTIKICNKLISKMESPSLSIKEPKPAFIQESRRWSFRSVKSYIGRLLSIITADYKPNSNGNTPVPEKHNLYQRYIISFFAIDLLRLPTKKPFMYSIIRIMQYVLTKSTTVQGITNNIFMNSLKKSSILAVDLIKLLRHTLFPTDSLMGPRRIIPTTEEQLKPMREEAVVKMMRVSRLYKIDFFLGLTQNDIVAVVDGCSFEKKKQNKLLIMQIMECAIAHFTRPMENNA